MTMEQLVELHAKTHGTSKVKAREEIDRVIALLQNATLDVGEISIPNFGRFKVKQIPAKRAYTPAGIMDIPASWKVRYTPFRGMKSAKVPATPAAQATAPVELEG